MRYEEEKRRLVSFCGSFCHTCDWFTGRIKNTAKKMLELVEAYEGFKRVVEGKVYPKDLVEGLRLLSETSICSGCKREIRERCEIVRCCVEKGFDHCDECAEFPLQDPSGETRRDKVSHDREPKRDGKGWYTGVD